MADLAFSGFALICCYGSVVLSSLDMSMINGSIMILFYFFLLNISDFKNSVMSSLKCLFSLKSARPN